nr:hypothetical protein [Tanacetum cinerariifolium]
MAQHIIPAAQLVPQCKPIGRCNNYTVLQSIPCSFECKIVGLMLLDHCLSYALTATADVPTVYLQQFWRTVSKEVIQYPRYTKLIIADLVKKFPKIPMRIEEDYHMIKDDVPLVGVYTTGNVSVRGMLIPDAFLTAENKETNDFKEYETMYMKLVILINQPQLTAGESSSPRRIIKKKRQPTPSILPPGDDKERDEMAEATLLTEKIAEVVKEKEVTDEVVNVSGSQEIRNAQTQDKMSRDVLTVGSTMRILLLYRGEYSQWVERFMNYLEEQTDGEAIINSIKNGDQPLPRVTQVSIAETSSNEQPPLKDKSMCNKTTKDLWDALARHMLGSKYGEQDRKVINDLKKCGYSNDNCELNIKFLNNLQPEWKQYATMMRQDKNLTNINIDTLYNILKQNQGDVNDAMGLKKKTVVVTFDPLALITEKTKVSKSKEKVVVSLNSKGSDADDFSELKKITALLAKAFNRRKFYSKPTNNNLRISSTSQSTNKKQEFVKTDNKKDKKKDDEKKRDMSKVKCYNCKKEGHFAKDCKKVKVKDYEYYKTKMLFAKKDKDEQVLLAEDQAWMELSSDSD